MTSVYSYKVDIWSAGVIMFEMLSREKVTVSQSHTIRDEITDLRCSDSAKFCLSQLLEVDPSKRPTARETLSSINFIKDDSN